jgi:type I restriction enzyme S subunit
VRAKREGRWRRGQSLPGLPQHLYTLFPDKLQHSESGEIPEGWNLEPLSNHFSATKGISYKGSGLSSNEGVPLHNLNSIYEGGGYKYEGIKYYKGDFADRHLVKPGDVIVANTEQGHNRLLIGYAAIIPSIFRHPGIASHHIFILRPKRQGALTGMFLCYLLNSARMHDIVSGYANGTTVNMLPIDGVQQPSIPIPPTQLVRNFDQLASAINARQQETLAESGTLIAMRDILLPKLISGEIRVKEAKSLVEGVV